MHIIIFIVTISSCSTLYGSSDIVLSSFTPTLDATIIHLGCMLLSFLGFTLMRNSSDRSGPNMFYVINSCVVLWSAFISLNFIFNTPITHYARYVDWIISAPLMLVALGLSAQIFTPVKTFSIIALVIALQVVGIVTGFLGDVTGPGPAAFTFYVLGTISLITTLLVVWNSFLPTAQSSSRHLADRYKQLCFFYTIASLGYPIVWILGTPTLQLFSFNTTRLLFTLVPILAKSGFGFLNLYILNKLCTEERSSYHYKS